MPSAVQSHGWRRIPTLTAVTFATSHLPPYLQSALSSDPARPRLTYYDDDTGERVELSAATLANWVTKTMNLLIDDLGVEAGARVSLHLPTHWLTAVWLIAADAVAAQLDAAPEEVDLRLGDRDSRDLGSGDRDSGDQDGETGHVVEVDTGFSREIFAVSLAPMAMPLGAALPQGTRDFCAEVRTMPDQLVSAPERSGTLNDTATARAAELDLQPADRVAVISTAPVANVPDLVDGLLVPLTVDGSAVWTRDPDPAAFVSRWRAERVTALVGAVPPGLMVPAEIRHLGLSTG